MVDSLTAGELRQLPLRGIIVLCARHAARQRAASSDPDEVGKSGALAAVDRAVRLAMHFAAGDEHWDNPREVVEAAFVAAGADAGSAGRAATCAVFAAGLVLTIHEHDDVRLVPEMAHSCLRDVDEMAARIRRDFEGLVRLGLGTFPECGAPVDGSEAGPLGPV